MSKSKSSVVSSSNGQKWHLRIDDGSVYGPVPTADLVLWAEDGRIAPGCELSADKKTWIPAEDLTDLAMDWVVKLDDGSKIGPINIKAIRDLLQEGAVDDTTTVTHCKTKKQSSIGDHRQEIEKASALTITAEAETDSEAEERLQRRIQALQSDVSQAQDALEKTRRNAENEAKRYNQTQKTTEAEAAQLREQVKSLSAEQAKLGASLKAAQENLSAARKEREEKEIDWISPAKADDKQDLAFQARESELEQKISALTQQTEATGIKLGEAQNDIEEQRQLTDTLKNQGLANEQELQAQIDRLKGTSEGASGELKQAREALEAERKKHTDLQNAQKTASSEAAKRVDQHQKALADAQEKLNAKSAALDSLKSESEKRQNTLESDAKAARVQSEQARQALQDATAKLKAAQNSSKGSEAAMAAQLGDMTRHIDALTRDSAEAEKLLNSALKDLADQVASHKQNESQSREAHASHISALDDLRGQTEKVVADFQAARAELTAERRNTQSTRSEISDL